MIVVFFCLMTHTTSFVRPLRGMAN